MQKNIEIIEEKVKSIKLVINSNKGVIDNDKDSELLSKKEKTQKGEIDTLLSKNQNYNFIDELNRVIKINKKLRIIYIILIILSSILIFGTVYKFLQPIEIVTKETSTEYNEMETKLLSSKNEIINLKMRIEELQNQDKQIQNLPDEEETLTNTGEVLTNSGETLTNTGEVLTNSGETLTNTGEVLTNSGETLTNTGEVLTNSGETLTSTGEVLTNSGEILTSTGEVLTNSGETLTSTGEVLTNSGEILITSEEIKDIVTEEEIDEIIEENKKIIEESGIKNEDFYTCKGITEVTNKITIRNRPGVENGERINMFYPGVQVTVLNYTKVDDQYWYQVITDDKFKGWMSDYGLQDYDINNCISLEKND